MKPQIEKVKFPNGAVGFYTVDVDGSVLWSVRFPAHACYALIDSQTNEPTGETHCEVFAEFEDHEAPQSYRHGKSPDLDAGISDLNAAYRLGRPTRETTTDQFVKA